MNNPSQPTPSADDVFQSPRKLSLSWIRCDPERRIGLPAGRDTSPHPFTSIILAAFTTGIIYVIAFLIKAPPNNSGLEMADSEPTDGFGTILWDLLTGYSGIPIFIVSLGMWAASILILKSLKIKAQRSAFKLELIPPSPNFRVTPNTVDSVVEHLESIVEEPSRFLLLERIISVLQNVRNVGRVSDIDEMFSSAADADEARMESSYTIVRGFIWAIPVIGFIGTIIGLTQAISQFGTVLSAGTEMSKVDTSQLGLVIAGLDTAFITTGEGLIVALILQLLMVAVRRSDELLLDDIRSTCTKRIMSRVRLEEEV